MEIRSLIDCSCLYVDTLEQVSEVALLLEQVGYVVAIDQARQVLGIVTRNDIQRCSSGILADCMFKKPELGCDQTVEEVLQIMRETGCFYLPVFDRGQFIGVVSLLDIAAAMEGRIRDAHGHYQRVIHDLRNPIANIRGLIAGLGTGKPDSEDRQLHQMLVASLVQASDILDDLLDAEGEQAEHPALREVEMNAFYQQCVSEQKGIARLKSISFIEDYLPVKVTREINGPTLKRAIHNIVSNAVKFSHPFGTIEIGTRQQGAKLVLEVRDSGVGIDDRFQPFIFDKFSRARRCGTIGEPSTGLGLYFSRQCIENHNGEISFKSSLGEGTRFYVTL